MAWSLPDTEHHTLDDWLATPEGDGYRYELIDGRIVVAPVGRDEHQELAIKLSYHFYAWQQTHKLGIARGEENVVLSPAHAVIPDALILLNEHLHYRTELGLAGPPDLVVEILSPSTRQRDLITKRRVYQQFGVPEYWLVDPVTRSLTCLVLRDGAYQETTAAETIFVSLTIPSLSIDLAWLFAPYQPAVGS